METLVDLFIRSEQAHGSRPAVTDDYMSLSYAGLRSRVELAAEGLAELGVRPGDAVGVLMARSADLVVAILATLSAGAAYVAVDDRYPSARQAHMLKAARVRVLVGARPGSQEGAEPALAQTPTVTVADLVASSPPDAAGPLPASRASDRASILFTSGTTGLPKGVELTHAGLVNFATNPDLPAIRPTDRMGQVSSVSFDAFHYELWCALAAGAEIVVLPSIADLLTQDPARELHRRAITAMLVPTMAVNHLLREDRETFSSLRVLCTGGDVLSARACRDLHESRFNGEFYNLYGPTEATTACTAYRVEPNTDPQSSVPIGRPLRGCQVQLLDDELKPVPDGGIGQIFVGGVGVARGYLEPEENAGKFVEDPSGGGNLYATGDLARIRTDGLLEFLGRRDNQTKVRGYRVEPYELEWALRANPSVEDAVVLAYGEGDSRQLAAFIVLDGQATTADIRDHLRERVPDYLVPAMLLKLDEVPATGNGKRDLDTLRRILREDLERRGRYRPPRTESERYLATLYEELLGVEQVGVEDDFFALGGHSLMAFRMQRRITRETGSRLTPEDVLRRPKVQELAAVLDGARPAKEQANA